MAKDFLLPLRKLHGALYEVKLRHELKEIYRKQFREKKKKNPKTVYLILTPEHGNLGDHAIASAETLLLDQCGISYLEITGKELGLLSIKHLLHMMNGQPIIISGGGNLGTLWMDTEDLIRSVIQENPKSRIFVLPNTIYYGNTANEQNEFLKSQEIYNQHKHLYLYAREQISYNMMKSAYHHVKLVPDMVLSLNKFQTPARRSGALLCLRSDCEKTLSAEQDQMIRQQMTALFGNQIQAVDTVINGVVSPDDREQALAAIFRRFSQAKCVVTDRLHGMIFCAITGTPCIVIDSKSPKVRGCYEWIRNLDYIRFADDPSQVTDAFRGIPQGVHHFDNSHLQHYYQELSDDILTVLNWR